MKFRTKLTLGCVAAIMLFIAGCIIYGLIINRHFERGSATTYGVVTSSAKTPFPNIC